MYGVYLISFYKKHPSKREMGLSSVGFSIRNSEVDIISAMCKRLPVCANT